MIVLPLIGFETREFKFVFYTSNNKIVLFYTLLHSAELHSKELHSNKTISNKWNLV